MTTTATIATGGQGGKSLTLTLPAGDLGTDCTCMAMRAVAEDAALRSERIRTLRRSLSAHGFLPLNLYHWLRQRCRFERDGRGLEHIRHPDQVLAQIDAAGTAAIDCDCLATLACAVLIPRHPCAVVVVGKQPAPAPFAHVFYATLSQPLPAWRLRDNSVPRGLVPYDPQENTPPGQMPGGVARFRVYPF